MRKFYLHPSFSTRADNLVIILGGRQFTIYEDYYVEQNVNITETDPRNDIDRRGPNLVFRGSLF